MIQMSVFASPGASAAFQCHCSQRAELTSEPFSSAKQVVGSWKTSVWMLAGSAGFCGPKSSQNRDVSVSSGSIVTRNFSLLRPLRILPRSGNACSGLKPWQMYPFIWPLSIISKARRMSYPSTSSFGSQS